MRLIPVRYSIDTSALIDAYCIYYPPDVFPAVWTFMEDLVARGALLAPEAVRDELELMGDWTTCAIEVADWMDVPIAETTEEGRRMGVVTPREHGLAPYGVPLQTGTSKSLTLRAGRRPRRGSGAVAHGSRGNVHYDLSPSTRIMFPAITLCRSSSENSSSSSSAL